jgi:hypothetical protein
MGKMGVLPPSASKIAMKIITQKNRMMFFPSQPLLFSGRKIVPIADINGSIPIYNASSKRRHTPNNYQQRDFQKKSGANNVKKRQGQKNNSWHLPDRMQKIFGIQVSIQQSELIERMLIIQQRPPPTNKYPPLNQSTNFLMPVSGPAAIKKAI